MSDDKVTPMDVILTPEMSQAIAMADRKPRAIKTFIKESIELATMDEQTAADCLYALPRKERDPITGDTVTKMIEGPSARLAEIINYQWGNCRAEGKITDDRGDFVTAQGTFIDLEKNSGVRTEVRRRITTKNGSRFGADMIMQTGNAAISIARRNSILAGIPKVFWVKIYEAARKAVAGDSHTLVNRRSVALQYMQKIGVTAEMILETLELKSVEDIGLDHLVKLSGMATAIKEGEATIEEIFHKKDGPKDVATSNGDDSKKKGKNAAPVGTTTQKARDALNRKKEDSGVLDEQSIAALRRGADMAGVGENALLEKFQVESFSVMTREQYDDALRYVSGILADNPPE